MQYLIQISDLVKYVGDSDQNSTRRYVEGQNVANANHLLYVGITAEEAEKVDLLGLCLQSTDLYGIPHELNLSIVTEINGKTSPACKCSCIGGGLDLCKHCVAFLIHLTRTQKGDIEIATCTDIKQTWGKLKSDVKAMYEVVPAKAMCHMNNAKKSKYKTPARLASKRSDVHKKMIAEHSDSMIAKFYKGYETAAEAKAIILASAKDSPNYLKVEDCRRIVTVNIVKPLSDNSFLYSLVMSDGKRVPFTFSKLTQDEKNFYAEHVQVDVNSAVDLCMVTRTQSGMRWMSERRKRISASTAYHFYTPLINPANKKNGKKIIDIDWDAKIRSHIHKEFKGNADTAYGIKNEPKARLCYEKKTGYTVAQLGSLVHPNISWLLSSLDGVVLGCRGAASPDGNQVTVPLHSIEIKCHTKGKKLSASELIKSLNYVEKVAKQDPSEDHVLQLPKISAPPA